MTAAMKETMMAKTLSEFFTESRPLNRKEAASWLEEIRRQAYEKFVKSGFPTRKQEHWRYTNLEKILKMQIAGKVPAAVHPDTFLSQSFLKGVDLPRLFLNDSDFRFLPGSGGFAAGVLAESLDAAALKNPDFLRPVMDEILKDSENSFECINLFEGKGGIVLSFPDDFRSEKPFHICLAGQGSDEGTLFSNPSLFIVLGKQAKVDIVFEHSSTNAAVYLMNTLICAALGEGSNLSWTEISKQSQNASRLDSTRIYLADTAQFRSVSFNWGGDINHNETRIFMRGKQSEAVLKGLAILNGHSQLSNAVTAYHEGSQTLSRQEFKNILTDDSQAEFNSLVHVGKNTAGCDSDQINRNLILSDHAKAYSCPQLKIDSDDVRAKHGSATGQLSADELFYLRSRGLNSQDAREVLTFGFAEEIMGHVADLFLRERLKGFVKTRISGMLQIVRKN